MSGGFANLNWSETVIQVKDDYDYIYTGEELTVGYYKDIEPFLVYAICGDENTDDCISMQEGNDENANTFNENKTE